MLWKHPIHQARVLRDLTQDPAKGLRKIPFPRTRVHKARSGWAVVPRLGSPHEDCQRLSAERGAAPGEGAPRRAMRLRPPLRHIQKAMMNAHTASRSKPTSLMIDGTKPS